MTRFKCTLILIFLLGIFISEDLFSQTTGLGHSGTAGSYLGWNSGTLISLDIRHNNARNIDFYTDSAFRMTILGNNLYNKGFVGVDLSSPRLSFEVRHNIGLIPEDFDEGYYIDSIPVLRAWGTENIFVGPSAGLNASNTGSENTFVGYRAGYVNTTGNHNTFVGRSAGISNITGDENTFLGNGSGANNVTGRQNVFVGGLAGQGTITGVGNTVLGYRAFSSSIETRGNTILGLNAAIVQSSGDSNCVNGAGSALVMTTGNRNVIVGASSFSNNTIAELATLVGYNAEADNALTNAAAIGSNTLVRHNNHMILGDDSVKVGIGLSGDASGPQNKLEINDNVNSGSGLRFKQLTAADSVSFTSNGKVLTVDADGDVVLTDDVGGNGSVTACGSSTGDVNYITKWTTITSGGIRQICKTNGIYEDNTWPYHVGIGVGSSPNTNMKLHMKGDFYVESDPGKAWGGDIIMNDASGIIRPVLAMYGLGGKGGLGIGHNAGNSDSLASIASAVTNSTFIGWNAGGSVTSNNNGSTFVGYNAAGACQDDYNTAVGYDAGRYLVTGTRNVFMGYAAGISNTGVSFTTGSHNIFIGGECQTTNFSKGSKNILMGTYTSLTASDSASNNVLIGNFATGSDNGSATPNDLIYAGAFGANSQTRCDSCIVIGNGNIHRIGIGEAQPNSTAMLDVNPRGTMAWAAVFRDTAIQVNSVKVASDQNLKEMVTPLVNVANLLGNLNSYSYKYKKEQFPNVGIDGGYHYGLMAQELEQVFPLLVSDHTADAMYDSTGNQIAPAVDYKTINYLELIPLLIQGFKEQQQTINTLTGQIAALQQVEDNSLSVPDSSINRSAITLNNEETVILNQNSPNPFKDKTDISYSIPVSVQNAVILFYDHHGKVLQQFEISHRGQGSLSVYGEDLTSGIYSYTLIIDGKNHQTKRMMKQ